MEQIRAETPDEAFYTLDPFHLVRPSDLWYCNLRPFFDDAHYQVLPKIQRLFQAPPRITRADFIHMGLIGHKGTGKSTLIRKATEDLAAQHIQTNFVASLSVFDQSDFTFSDVVLVTIQAISAYLHERKINIPKIEHQLVMKWFSEELLTEQQSKEVLGEVTTQAEAGYQIPFIANLMAKLTATLRSKSEYRTEIRSKAERDSNELIRNANLFIDAATSAISQENKSTFLVVFDDLEKISNRALVDTAILRRADELRQLRCHLIFLLDPADQYAPITTQASNAYATVHVPNLHTRGRDDPLEFVLPNAVNAVSAILEKRVDLNKVFAQPLVAVEKITSMSGGRLRDIMAIARQACELSNTNKVSIAQVETAIRSVRSQKITAVRPDQWQRLAEIHRDKQISSQESDAYLLLHSLVLNYNGEQWFDIHPLLRADQRFEKAWKTLPNS